MDRRRAYRGADGRARTGLLTGLALLAMGAAAACAPEGGADVPAADPAEARQAFDAFIAAWETQDLDAALGAFTDDAVAFDPVPPFKFEGPEAIRSWIGGAFDTLDEISIDVEDVRSRTEGHVAWVTARYAFRGTPVEGEAFVDEGHVTMLWVRTADGSYRSPLFHASRDEEEGEGA